MNLADRGLGGRRLVLSKHSSQVEHKKNSHLNLHITVLNQDQLLHEQNRRSSTSRGRVCTTDCNLQYQINNLLSDCLSFRAISSSYFDRLLRNLHTIMVMVLHLQ